MSEIILQHLNQYTVIEAYKKGPNGQAFRVLEKSSNRIVIIKILNSELSNNPQFRGPALTNIKSIAKIDHPSICTVSEILKVEDRFVIIQEYFDGVPITEYFKNRKIENSYFLQVISTIVNSLVLIHREKFHHGNIKPSNILVNQKGQVAILDYGYANTFDIEKVVDENYPDDDLQYLAPEVIHGESTSRCTDLYSLGVIFYEILFENLPFKGENNKELLKAISYELPDIRAIYKKNYSGDTVLMIEKLLAKNPNDRFLHASELKITVDEMLNYNEELKKNNNYLKKTMPISVYLMISLFSAGAIILWFILSALLRK